MWNENPVLPVAPAAERARSHARVRRGTLLATFGAFLTACAPLPTVPVEERLHLSQTALSFSFLGATEQIGVTLVDEFGLEAGGADVLWKTSAPSVATVSQTGVVTALANGSTTVTAEYGESVASVRVTVAQAPSEVTFSVHEIVLGGPGEAGTIGLSVRDGGGSALEAPEVSWWSEDPDVAVVAPGGLVTAVAPGWTQIGATITGGGRTMVERVPVTVEGESGSRRDHSDQDVPDDEGPDVEPTDAILIDATHDGGVWWFPQAGPFDPSEHHQGRALADRLRHLGYTVVELGRDEEVTDRLLDRYRMVIRAGSYGAYTASEMSAYERYVARSDARLMLVTNFLRLGQVDPIGRSIGLRMEGMHYGVMTPVAAHAITDGVGSLTFGPGAAVDAGSTAAITPLAALEDGRVVMGLVTGQPAGILFFGQLLLLERPPEPLVSNLARWLSGAHVGADAAP